MYKRKKSREETSSLLIIANDLSTRSNTNRPERENLQWSIHSSSTGNKMQCWGKQVEKVPGIPQLEGVSNFLLDSPPLPVEVLETLHSQAIPVSPSDPAVLRAESRPMHTGLRIQRDIAKRCTEQKSCKQRGIIAHQIRTISHHTGWLFQREKKNGTGCKIQ